MKNQYTSSVRVGDLYRLPRTARVFKVTHRHDLKVHLRELFNGSYIGPVLHKTLGDLIYLEKITIGPTQPDEEPKEALKENAALQEQQQEQ